MKHTGLLMAKKTKVGGTPTLKNLSSSELITRILRELENLRNGISGMRLHAQQRRWGELLQAWSDQALLEETAAWTIREIRTRVSRMAAPKVRR